MLIQELTPCYILLQTFTLSLHHLFLAGVYNSITKKKIEMKTRSLVCGALIAAVSALALTPAKAQTQPTIKVLPGEKDMIKVMYYGQSDGAVTVRFAEGDGSSIISDKISGKNFDKGFLKKYKLNRDAGDSFLVEVSDGDAFVRYRVFSNTLNEWSAQLEKETYNYPVIAANKPSK